MVFGPLETLKEIGPFRTKSRGEISEISPTIRVVLGKSRGMVTAPRSVIMPIYLVRTIDEHDLVGIFVTPNLLALALLVDECVDPGVASASG
jgi:hypothetical protein